MAKWPTEWVDVDDNIAPLSDKRVLKAVKGWAKDWKKNKLDQIQNGLENFKGDKFMAPYFRKRKTEILSDKFTFDSNVYDVEEETNNLPKNRDGYWAVMVDMHN